MVPKVKLSLLIPAYNEQKILEKTLKKVIDVLSGKKYSWEIIVIDDGSSDNTAKITKKFANKGVKLVRYEVNRGKGGALKEGVEEAAGEYIVFSDADLSVPISTIDKFYKALSANDVVIGSRRIKGANILIHQPFLRETMGRVYTMLTQMVTGVNLSDFTCGFKGFRKKAAKKIFSKTQINRWAYDSEILYLAKKFGFKVVEIPVEWRNREDSRVVLQSVILESFADLLAIRINDFFGKYQ